MSNVKRPLPVTGSRPIVPMMRPTTAIISALTSDLPVTLLRTTKPNTISEANSGGPNASAASASGGASRTRPKIAIVPAMKEPSAAIASAGPARPACAIL